VFKGHEAVVLQETRRVLALGAGGKPAEPTPGVAQDAGAPRRRVPRGDAPPARCPPRGRPRV